MPLQGNTIRAQEAILEVATNSEFTDAQKVGVAQNVNIGVPYMTEGVMDIGSFEPVANELVGHSMIPFGFSLTPEVESNLVDKGIIPDPRDPTSFAGFHFRLRKYRGPGVLKTFARLIDCQPSNVGYSMDAQSLGRVSFQGTARTGSVLSI